MNCLYCHYTANKSPDPGLPAVGTCMGCHTVIRTDKPEVQKLAAFWNKKQPVPWVRIHKLPEYVHFPHMRHVNAGVSCQTCHGQMSEHGAGVSAELAQHGMVRELSRRPLESSAQGALRLRGMSLLMKPSAISRQPLADAKILRKAASSAANFSKSSAQAVQQRRRSAARRSASRSSFRISFRRTRQCPVFRPTTRRLAVNAPPDAE